ncbi:hypothetical protein CDEST_00482 [Colletotrichum destructivum]|uniref:Uncharacterized protein n=1 Tax=Colletotrichum destructivum TaxID=34406 RepID=A0AAX4HWC3_9PEZI|nr:hypothetical protein CDEST_00482 [Colletotrichum destructivum]
MLILSGPLGSSACKDTVCAMTEHVCSSTPRNMIQATLLALEAEGRSRQTPGDMISGRTRSISAFSSIVSRYPPSAIRLSSPRDAVSAGSSRSRRLPLLLCNGVDARGPHQLRPAVADRRLKPATGAGHKGTRSENDLNLLS